MDLLQANWRTAVSLSTAWSTDVTVASSLSEERRALVERPYRTMEVLLSGMDQETSTRIMLAVMKAQDTRMRVPLYCDHSRVTADSSGTTLWCSTVDRRFHVGAMIVVHEWDQGRPVNAQHRQILTVLDDRLILTSALTGTIAAGGRAYPTIDGEVSLEGAAKLLSDHHNEVLFKVVEATGESALPSSCESIPLRMQTHDGHAILDLQYDFKGDIDVGFKREGRSYPQGRGKVVAVEGSRPQVRCTLPMRGLDRERSFALVQFFDAVRGRQRAFFLVMPDSTFSLVATSTSYVDVQAVGSAADVDAYVDYVAVVMRDGAVHLRGLDSVTDNGSTFRLNLDTSLPAIVDANVRKVTVARLVRMEEESQVEQWETDGHCSVSMSVVELLEEKDVDIDLAPGSELPGDPGSIANLHYWLDAASGTWNDKGGLAPFTADRECRQHPDASSTVHVWYDVRGQAYPYGIAAGAGRKLATLTDASLSGSRRVLEHAHTGSEAIEIQDVGSPPWDNTLGWTMFIALRTSSAPPQVVHFYRVTNADGTAFDWLHDQVKVYQASDVADPSLWITGARSATDGDSHVLVFAWKPGDYARLYYDGILQGQADVGASFMPTTTTLLHQLNQVSNAGATPAVVMREAGIPEHFFDYAAISYRRALDAAEINLVGQHLSQLYGTRWTDLP